MDRRIEALMKKKKMDKLSAFFGKSPVELLSPSMENLSVGQSTQEIYVPPTHNDLDPAKKSQIIKRQKKIQVCAYTLIPRTCLVKRSMSTWHLSLLLGAALTTTPLIR
jgi:hypothetical protein